MDVRVAGMNEPMIHLAVMQKLSPATQYSLAEANTADRAIAATRATHQITSHVNSGGI
jgi:hypothetical protein